MMLAHFNGILSYEKGKYELNVETQESTPALSNSFNGVNYMRKCKSLLY